MGARQVGTTWLTGGHRHRAASFILLFLLLAAPAAAQEADTLRSYDLGEIVVESREERARGALHVREVKPSALARADAAALPDLAALVPGARVQTNSRGETLLYLRGAGERQTAVFFDGALLNVPWDQRFDLALVPASILGGIRVAPGPSSVLYGTNALGGAVNLTARQAAAGSLTEVLAAGGTGERRALAAAHLGRRGAWDYAAATDLLRRDGYPLPEGADFAFHQPGEDLRTNTQMERGAFYARLGRRFEEEGALALSALHLRADQGVAPEGSEADARFWRYPEWRNTMLILNGRAPERQGVRVRGAAWLGSFQQQIDSYDGATYDERVGVQEDDDLTLGMRLVGETQVLGGRAQLALNALTSRHLQQEGAVADDGVAYDPEQTYRQHIGSVGAEWAGPLGERWQASLGASLDGVATPRTGDKPERAPQGAYGLAAGLSHALRADVQLFASAARRVRFPTPRELFGVALDRFALNDDLRPETAYLAEAGVRVQRPVASFELLGFVRRTVDSIDQRRLEDGRRQRINLDGSRVLGVEAIGAVRPHRRVRIDGHATLLDTRAFLAEGDRELVETPQLLATLGVLLRLPFRMELGVQARGIGRAYALGADNDLVPLPRALVFDARLSHQRRFDPVLIEAFVGVDNATDELVLPQLGLPGPGRTWRLGLRLLR